MVDGLRRMVDARALRLLLTRATLKASAPTRAMANTTIGKTRHAPCFILLSRSWQDFGVGQHCSRVPAHRNMQTVEVE